MIDLHAHVLPGIDDGPISTAEAVVAAAAAAREGVRSLAATPHVRPDHPAVRPRDLARCAIHSCKVRIGTPAAAIIVPNGCRRLWNRCDVSSFAAQGAARIRRVTFAFGPRVATTG